MLYAQCLQYYSMKFPGNKYLYLSIAIDMSIFIYGHLFIYFIYYSFIHVFI